MFVIIKVFVVYPHIMYSLTVIHVVNNKVFLENFEVLKAAMAKKKIVCGVFILVDLLSVLIGLTAC